MADAEGTGGWLVCPRCRAIYDEDEQHECEVLIFKEPGADDALMGEWAYWFRVGHDAETRYRGQRIEGLEDCLAACDVLAGRALTEACERMVAEQ